MSSLFPDTLAGNSLPPFKTLLIKGPYHPSAPIHLCLSHTSTHPQSRSLFLTPSRTGLKDALAIFNDDWLTEKSGHGTVSEISSRIKIFYPPSPVHLALLLSALRIYEHSENVNIDAKTTLEVAPVLVVLHELSAYFLDGDTDTSYTVSAYLSLVASALASVAFMSAQNGSIHKISFVLFDSKLDQLKLPVLRAPSPLFIEPGDSGQSPRLESVAGLVQKYFEWLGIFEKTNSSPGEFGIEQERRSRLRLYQINQAGLNTKAEWNWIEYDGLERGNSEQQGTLFSWVD